MSVAGVSLDRVLALTGGRCLPARSALPERIDACTDTRALQPGQVFVALAGERFDGHAFVEAARARGAAAAVVARADALPAGFPGVVVADTTRAYLACGEAAREELAALGTRVAAVTGSVGKTTTKEFCRALCEGAGLGPVRSTPANENNEIGVAHLLLRALRSTPLPRLLVMEMGARHAGEIAELARAARPDVGVLTGVGESHLANFASLEELRETKWGLFAFGARPVLNAGDAASMDRLDRVRDRAPVLCSAAPRSHANVNVTPSAQPARDGEIEICVRDGGGAAADTAPRTWRTPFPIPGAHHRLDLALALGAVCALGGDLDRAVQAIPRLTLPEGRYQAIDLPNGVRAVYDAYNAAPASAEAALRTFAGAEGGQRRIAVLSSMAELGSDAAAMHRRVGALAGSLAGSHALDAILVGGDYAEALEQGALAGGAPPQILKRFTSNAEAAAWLRGNLRPGDIVLLKGSRRYLMEEILEELRR